MYVYPWGILDFFFKRHVCKKQNVLFAMALSKAHSANSHYPYYAVGRGLNPDVYLTWFECFLNTHRVSGNKYKGFHSFEKAQDFVRRHYKVLRRKMSSRGSGSLGTHSPSYLDPSHRKSAQVLASHIMHLILVQKFLPSAVYLVIKGCRFVTRGQASLLLHAIGDGINDGDWSRLGVLCAQLVPPVVASILRGLNILSETPDPHFRQDSFVAPPQQHSAGPVLHGNIDEETYVGGGVASPGLPNGNGSSGIGQG